MSVSYYGLPLWRKSRLCERRADGMRDERRSLWDASGSPPVFLIEIRNSHGLDSRAPRTGKTVTLQTLPKDSRSTVSRMLMADVPGDLSGSPARADQSARESRRAKQLRSTGMPARPFRPVLTLFGEKGSREHDRDRARPVRWPVAVLLKLNDTRKGLEHRLKLADEQGLLLLDFKDLQAVPQWTAENSRFAHHPSTAMSARERRPPFQRPC